MGMMAPPLLAPNQRERQGQQDQLALQGQQDQPDQLGQPAQLELQDRLALLVPPDLPDLPVRLIMEAKLGY
jgi:hypothetical protein